MKSTLSVDLPALYKGHSSCAALIEDDLDRCSALFGDPCSRDVVVEKEEPACSYGYIGYMPDTQVKGLFVVAVVAADVAEATWVPVGAGVVWEGQP